MWLLRPKLLKTFGREGGYTLTPFIQNPSLSRMCAGLLVLLCLCVCALTDVFFFSSLHHRNAFLRFSRSPPFGWALATKAASLFADFLDFFFGPRHISGVFRHCHLTLRNRVTCHHAGSKELTDVNFFKLLKEACLSVVSFAGSPPVKPRRAVLIRCDIRSPRSRPFFRINRINRSEPEKRDRKERHRRRLFLFYFCALFRHAHRTRRRASHTRPGGDAASPTTIINTSTIIIALNSGYKNSEIQGTQESGGLA